MDRIDVRERKARLGRRHHLAAPGGGLEEVSGDLCGLHATDPATVYLAARARVVGLAIDDVEAALYERRSLLRMLGMRRTMFVVPRDLAAEIDTACARPIAARERQQVVGMLEGQGLAPDGAAWIDDVQRRVLESLDQRGEATAIELTEDVPELSAKFSFGEGKTWAGTVGTSTKVLFLLAAEGRIVRGRPRGSWLSSQHRWSSMASWLGAGLPSLDPEEARADLVRRWLRTYGPGTLTDLTWWTGWGKRVTRAALDTAGAVEVDLGTDTGYALGDDLEATPPPEPWAALLPSLDPTVMGWKQRGWYLDDDLMPELFDRNGNAGPTVWWDGRVVGAWTQLPDATVATSLLVKVPAEGRAAIDEKRAELEGWLDGTVVTPRFAAPLEKRLRMS